MNKLIEVWRCKCSNFPYPYFFLNMDITSLTLISIAHLFQWIYTQANFLHWKEKCVQNLLGWESMAEIAWTLLPSTNIVAGLSSFADDCSLRVFVGDETFPDLLCLCDFAVESENPKILDFTSLTIISKTKNELNNLKMNSMIHLIN